MRLLFLKNYRKVLSAVWAVCFALGFVAGVWIGPSIATRMANRRTAHDQAPPADTVSSADVEPVQGFSAESRQTQEASDTPERQPEIMIMPAKGRTVGAYGWYRDSAMDDWRFRDGLDIECVPGTSVAAALSGSVTEVSRARDGGYSVSLKHAGDVNTAYVNLRAVWVDVGQQVAAGKPLGDIGAATSASGGVLRFMVECDGQSKDPAVCLGQRF